MDDTILEIALHLDLVSTQTLHCVSKDIEYSLNKSNIWLLKFQCEFSRVAYYDWWTAFENYKLQKKYKGKMCLWVNDEEQDIDRIIHKYSVKVGRMSRLHLYSGKNSYGQVKIDLTLAGKYLVCCSAPDEHYDEYVQLHKTDDIDSISELINDDFKSKDEDPYYYYYLVINLSDLELGFNLDENEAIHAIYHFFLFICARDLSDITEVKKLLNKVTSTDENSD